MTPQRPLTAAVVSHSGDLPAGLPGELARLIHSPREVRSSDDLLLFHGSDMANAVRVFAQRLGPRMLPALVLATRYDPADVALALEHGAISYLVVGRFSGCLLAALSATARGTSYLDPRVQSELVRFLRTHTVRPPTWQEAEVVLEEGRADQRALTPRESEVMGLLASGLTVREMARRLSVSEKTVRNTLSRAYRKLNVRRQPEAVLAWLGRMPERASAQQSSTSEPHAHATPAGTYSGQASSGLLP